MTAAAPPASERNRLAVAALVFAIAAAISSWNPLAAPFGLVVGVASLVIAVRAVRRPRRRRLAIAAIVTSALAVAASALVLALTAGIGRELGGTPIVESPAREDAAAELDQAAERTEAARERARKELDALEKAPQPGPRPADRANAR